MKAKLFTIAIVAIIGIAVIGCKEDEPDPVLCTCPNGTVHTDKPCDCGGEGCTCTYKQPITREFIIQIDGNDIKVVDTRTGSNDTDLDELGIITRLDTALNSQKGAKVIEVLGRSPEIYVEDTTDYNYYKAYSATKLGLNFSCLSDPNEDISDLIATSVYDMYEAPYPKQV